MTNYTYLLGALVFFAIWITLYLYKKQYRKKMLIISALSAPLGPITEFFHFQDYWNPTYLFTFFGVGIEDIIFGFSIGGIAAVIYGALFVNKTTRTKKEPGYKIIILTMTGFILFITLNLIFKINSIHASSIAFLFIAIIILIKRKDLIKNAIISGILISLIMFIFYLLYTAIFPNIIQSWWQLEKLSGIMILGVPIEELTWGFALGFLIGPIYEFWKGKKEITQ